MGEGDQGQKVSQSRLQYGTNHLSTAQQSPNLSEVFQKALTEYRPATDWPAVEVAGLTRNPRGKIAVVGHQSLTVLSLILFLVRQACAFLRHPQLIGH